MSALHTETRGRFRWLQTVEDADGLTIRTARAELSSGIVVECVTTCDSTDVDGAVVFVTDLAGCEATLTTEQATELVAALSELPR